MSWVKAEFNVELKLFDANWFYIQYAFWSCICFAGISVYLASEDFSSSDLCFCITTRAKTFKCLISNIFFFWVGDLNRDGILQYPKLKRMISMLLNHPKIILRQLGFISLDISHKIKVTRIRRLTKSNWEKQLCAIRFFGLRIILYEKFPLNLRSSEIKD